MTKITFTLIEGQHHISEIELGEGHAMDKLGDALSVYPVNHENSFEEMEYIEKGETTH